MSIKLPQLFSDKMKSLLGERYEVFIASYERPRKYGLRVNGLKLTGERFAALSPFGERLSPVPWAEGAYYYEESDRPGKHPHYHAGLYYIQEPSAMVPGELLGVQPGDRVLDLCAAPGGKSTQLAAKLQGRGVLVANDNARERTKALAKNIELAGVRNAVILNEEPAALAAVFEEWFDRILVDAPCSGEGMFRKDESMIAEWERHSVERCSSMQRGILPHAVRMLAPGGTLVYSTCTFSPEENECQIAALLKAFPELEVIPVELRYGWAPGRPDWAGLDELAAVDDESGEGERNVAGLAGTVRLWPHLTEGEGHYAAVLRKRSISGAGGNAWRAASEWGAEAEQRGGAASGAGGEARRGASGRSAEAERRGGAASGAGGEARRGVSERSAEAERRGGAASGAGGEARRGASGRSAEAERRGDAASGAGGEARRGASGRSAEAERRGGAASGAEARRGVSERAKQAGGARGGAVSAAVEPRGRKAGRGERLKRLQDEGSGHAAVQAWKRFAAEHLIGAEHWYGEPVAYGSRVYLQPAGLPSLAGLRVVRAGWYVGEAGPHRFEPSQPLAMGLRPEEVALMLRLRADEDAALRYLKGETLHIDAARLVRQAEASAGRPDALDATGRNTAKGYVLVCADDFPIGWGKISGDGLLKNELAPGWRWM